ncbi:MAG: alcohol dehydrogenase catalytic domain-containing protein [Nitrospinae bacterium]|nr:alcohol dehydrogenase catalytic domain-containing protein [Nitrospinota bacterium]
MKAVIFDGTLKVCDVKQPKRGKDEVLIKVSHASICNTDHEIMKGYIPNFKGILGHEFFGFVVDADDKKYIGNRVTGEINIACGGCELCKKGLGRHCPHRSVLGIQNKDGAFAEFVTLPLKNVVEIPPDIPDSHAIFIEPLAAALEILEQVTITQDHSVLLIGDGKLALLIAYVLQSIGCNLTVVGKHPHKLKLLEKSGIKTTLFNPPSPPFNKGGKGGVKFDIVVEASGNPSGFNLGLECVKPRGILVLKSTYAAPFNFNPFSIVVNEITVVGSRCGRFEKAIHFLQTHKLPFEKLISSVFDLKDAPAAFKFSARHESLKVLLRIGEKARQRE